MTMTHTRYNAVTIRQSVETLQCALVDPQLDCGRVALAHAVIRQAHATAPPIVAPWIDTYLKALSHAREGSDVVAAIGLLAQRFKLPTPERPPTIPVQGRLFD